MKSKPLFVRAEWDEETRVWVAKSDDMPGLATEKDTFEWKHTEKIGFMSGEILIPDDFDSLGASNTGHMGKF